MKQPAKRNQTKDFPERQTQKQTGEQKQGVMGVRQAPQAVRLCFKRRKPAEPKGFLTDRSHTTKKTNLLQQLKNHDKPKQYQGALGLRGERGEND